MREGEWGSTLCLRVRFEPYAILDFRLALKNWVQESDVESLLVMSEVVLSRGTHLRGKDPWLGSHRGWGHMVVTAITVGSTKAGAE